MLVIHHNDLDGLSSAAIVYKAYRETVIKDSYIDFFEADYDKEIPLDKIHKDEDVYIVDFSLKPAMMNKLLKITKNIIWIDHHKTALEYEKDYESNIDGYRVVEDQRMAGCELTWDWFYPELPYPDVVKYIGDFDKWAWKYRGVTEYYKEGLYVRGTNPTNDLWIVLLDPLCKDYTFYNTSIIADGKICKQYRDNIFRQYVDNFGFETEFEGYKCFAAGLYMFGSEVFGDKIKDYEMLISFEYEGAKYLIGLYSQTIDVSRICQKYGGGGHTGAGGFTCKTLPFVKD